MTKPYQQLDPQHANNLFKILEQCFQTHMERHEHVYWADIHEQLLRS